MKRLILSLACCSILLAVACTPTAITGTPQLVNIYATASAQTWLQKAFQCAPPSVVINVSDEQSADMMIRIGEPKNLTTPSYQIDSEDILIITNRQSPIQNLSLEQVRELFAGEGDPSVQVWVYSSGEDVQEVFDQQVMEGRSVTSLARLAVNPQQMSDVLNNQVNTVGILSKHWKAGDARFVYTIPKVPVLAITKTEPDEILKTLIACLQK